MSYFENDWFAHDIKALWNIFGGLAASAAILTGVVLAQAAAKDNRDGFQYEIRRSIIGDNQVTLSHRRNLDKSYLTVKTQDGCLVEYSLNNAPDGTLTLEQKIVVDREAFGGGVGGAACEARYKSDGTVLGGAIKATPALEKYVRAITAAGSP